MFQLIKNLPAVQETWIQSLDWEDPLEKRKAIPTPVFWPGEFHGLFSPWGHQELDLTNQLSLSFTSTDIYGKSLTVGNAKFRKSMSIFIWHLK